MRIEEEVFQRRKIRSEALGPFGFTRDGECWRYEEIFMGGDFRVELTVGPDGKLSGRVVELSTEEEYLPVQIASRTGAFVSQVREAYRAVLERVAAACSEPRPFRSEQANRLAQAIFSRYGEEPDNPFSGLPEASVFRYPPSRKWYALVMDVRRSVVTGEKTEEGEESPLTEVMNLKADPARIPKLHALPGIWPGYHMNHAHWISILLDDELPDETILSLIDASRKYALGGKRDVSQPKAWIVPANPKYYDIDAAFEKEEEILWKQGRGIRPGDTAYMYVAAPVSALRYECRVTETMIPYPYSDENLTMTHVMKIRRLRTFPPERFPLEKLRTFGVRMLHGPREMPEALLKEIGT